MIIHPFDNFKKTQNQLNQTYNRARNGCIVIFMLPAQEDKIKEVFATAKCLAVISGEDATEETLLAKEALVEAIRNTGLSVYSFPERKSSFSEKWQTILSPTTGSTPTFSTSILIPKNKIAVKEISYGENDHFVSIDISTTKEEITKENVIFKTTPVKVDSVFYFPSLGQNNLATDLPEDLFKKINLPEQEKIITLSSASGNETIAEKVFSAIQIIEADGDVTVKNSSISNILLASIFAETNQLQENISEKVLDLASSLMRLGANKEKINNIFNDKNASFAKLLGRALARSQTNESLNSVWTFLSEQDLEKTVKTPDLSVFSKIIKKIKIFLENRPVFVLVWQYEEEVWALLDTSAKNSGEMAEKLKTSLSATKKDGGLISGPYKNFSEAEIKIQSALKDIV